MKTITMLYFRKNAVTAIREIQKGRKLLLTYRGKPVVQLEPVKQKKRKLNENDSLFELLAKAEADPKLSTDGSLSNREIDQILYGKP